MHCILHIILALSCGDMCMVCSNSKNFISFGNTNITQPRTNYNLSIILHIHWNIHNPTFFVFFFSDAIWLYRIIWVQRQSAIKKRLCIARLLKMHFRKCNPKAIGIASSKPNSDISNNLNSMAYKMYLNWFVDSSISIWYEVFKNLIWIYSNWAGISMDSNQKFIFFFFSK